MTNIQRQTDTKTLESIQWLCNTWRQTCLLKNAIVVKMLYMKLTYSWPDEVFLKIMIVCGL